MPGIGAIRLLPGGKSTLANTISLEPSGPIGTPSVAGDDAIHGGGPSSRSSISTTAGSASPTTISPVTFSVQSSSGEGIALYDSGTQKNNDIVLVLRTLIGGQNIEISTSDGQIIIESKTSMGATGPTGPPGVGVFTPIIDGTVLGNVTGAITAASAITLTDLIDHTIGKTVGAMLYRSPSGWSVISLGLSGQVLGSTGTAPLWQTLGTMANQPASNVEITGGTVTAALTATSLNMAAHKIVNLADPVNSLDAVNKSFVEKISINFSLPDKTPPAITVQVGITRSMILTFGASNPMTYCITSATAASVFTLKYVHSNVTTMIGTIIFGPSGAPIISSVVTVSLVAGDVLQLITPANADATLADVLITLMTTLQ
jgi:hypothetical protein